MQQDQGARKIEICYRNIEICYCNIEICYRNTEICNHNIEICYRNIEICYCNIEICYRNIDTLTNTRKKNTEKTLKTTTQPRETCLACRILLAERQPLIKQNISLRPKDLFLRDRLYTRVTTVQPLTSWWRERHTRPGSGRSFIYLGNMSRSSLEVFRRTMITVTFHGADFIAAALFITSAQARPDTGWGGWRCIACRRHVGSSTVEWHAAA